MRKFSFYGIRREECEFTSCSSLIGESRFSAYRSTLVGSCKIFNWIAWLLWPVLRLPSPVEGIGVSDMTSVICG